MLTTLRFFRLLVHSGRRPISGTEQLVRVVEILFVRE
ncbi:Dynein gamma chain, flagellar outer arm [Giardia duodenalis]|uniref:Dynein gamma chain, flagellar outer arm n=1 Tax=Giardia intestinalis TaxID=5741 RepID=V6TYZ6_GIAIN|nr:Dynein gamma chain, flagellar outer arm [Giardia intestinalis]